jgi:nucleoside-diphosphate-sugar epimerase
LTPAVLVTGASGFIGRALVAELHARGRQVMAAVRTPSSDGNERVVGEIGPETDWSGIMRGVEVIVHAAGRAHVPRGAAHDVLSEFRRVNVEGSRRLALQAAECGAKRIVFISSIGVMGNDTDGRAPFSVDDAPAPKEHYAVSKLEAEIALREVADQANIEVVVVRPPLVYGARAPGNFTRLLRLIRSGWPLPFGAVENCRSFVSLENLVDLLIRCADAPAAAGQTFLVADGQDISTPELLRKLAAAMGQPLRLIPVPMYVLRLAGRVAGRRDELQRLIGSLRINIRHTCETLDWIPPLDLEESLRRAVDCDVR